MSNSEINAPVLMEREMNYIGSKIVTRPFGVVIASTIGIALGITSTIQTVFSLFLIPIATEFDTTRSSVSAVLLLIAFANALIYPLIGRLADQLGARIIILSGLVLFSVSVALTSQVQSLMHLYIAYSMIGISGSVLGPILFTKIISGWFDRGRGLFLGIIGGVGNGVGSALMPIYVFMLLSSYGWRIAYQGIAMLILAVGFPILFCLLRDPPSGVSNPQAKAIANLDGLTFKESCQTKTFWWLLGSISACTGCLMAVFTHIIPILSDRGINVKDATSVLATFAMTTVVAQVSIGALLDKLRKPRAISPFFLTASAGIVILSLGSTMPVLFLAAILMGFGLGAEFGLLPFSISRYFGLKDYGTISGVMYSVVAVTTGITPVLMDVVFDISGSYDFAMTLASLGMVLGAIVIALMPKFGILFSEPTDFSAEQQSVVVSGDR